MAKTKTAPPRSAVKAEHTWDLTELFKSDKAWETGYRKLEKLIPGFERFRGQLGSSPEALLACCEYEDAFHRLEDRLGAYAYLKSSEDLGNSTYQGMLSRYIHLATRGEEAMSFIAPEIQAIPKKRMEELLEAPELAPYRFALEKLLRYRPHIRSEEVEQVLAMQGEVAGTAGRIFDQLVDADLKFGEVEDEKGRKVALTHASFRSLLESPERAVRKRAFLQYYAQFEAHENALAAALSSSVLQGIYQARVRNYPSALEAGLFSDRVPTSVYDNLIQTVRDHLDPLFHYLEVRRKALKLRDIRMYDTYVPIVRPKRFETSFEEATEMICEALQPLGSAYCRALHKGLTGRWVDRYENKGKASGAYSYGTFDGPPYILMNYRDDVIDSVFTLAHEAGHSMHSYYSSKHQPYQYHQYTIFVAEVASTFNEILLNRYLMDRADDKRMRAFLINKEIDEIRGTLVRQTMFAEFEKVMHAIAEAGQPLTVETLRREYRKLLEAYFGPKFKIDDCLTLEGLRIPHFYRAFYVYKYATGISAAIALSERVLQGGAAERDAYLGFLKAGGSKYPIDILRDAGVDMEQPGPIVTAMRRLEALVGELEALL